MTGGTGVLRLGRKDGTRNGTDGRANVKEDHPEPYHKFGAPVMAPGRRRLAEHGVLPNVAGPKAQMSRASMPFL